MVSSGLSRAAAKLAGSQRPLRSVEVKSAGHGDAPTFKLNLFPKQPPSLDPVPAVVVPLPRRPLFPGYFTCAYLKNQPTLEKGLAVTGASTVAAFMLKDTRDYRGCILRPGLNGRELLERLHPVGTLAEVMSSDPETKQLCLLGRHRVKMTDTVVEDDPLTVMVQPLVEEEEQGHAQLERLIDDNCSQAEVLAREMVSVFGPYRDTFLLLRSLTGQDVFDPNGHVGRHLNQWGGDIAFLADFGPAVMPVFNKGLHQRALEETNRSRRLELSNNILKREQELDNFTRRVDLDEDDLSYEEKEILAKLRCREERNFVLGEADIARGELLMASSVQMRVVLSEFHNLIRPDHLKKCMDLLKYRRISEHMLGY